MNPKAKLIVIKTIHTAVWVFYNVVIFYLLYAVTANKIDKWVWICISLVLLEIIILILFKRMCPVTLLARKYSDSSKGNFDIYLPEWLAKNNKLIYSIIFSIGLLILTYRLLT
jgi:hypothetical protein